MKMKSFKQFMNEADIKGNPAVSPEYLASLNKRAEASAREIEQKYGRDMMNLRSFVTEVQSIQRGKERDVEALTRAVIEKTYGAILRDTELDIRIPTDPDEMGKIMKSTKDKDNEAPPQYKEVEDDDTKIAIHKRKILNMEAQGEAINSKKMLMGDQNREGLAKIFGEDKAERMIDLLVKITDICNARDWRIPEEVGATMIEKAYSLSGVSKIDWEPEDKKDKESEDSEESDETPKTPDIEQEAAKLIILGVDQAMLFHEAVKAIIGLINQGGLAHLDDETIAKVFMNADTAADEVQDLKRAKLTAGDLRDFILTFPEVNTIENFREYVWGKMIDATVLPDREFLQLMNLIFTAAPLYRKIGEREPQYSEAEIEAAREAMPKAKRIVQRLVDMIKDELAEWEESMRSSEYDDDYYSSEEPGSAPSADFEPTSARRLSKDEIRDLIDQAIDRGDQAEFKRLSDLLNYT